MAFPSAVSVTQLGNKAAIFSMFWFTRSGVDKSSLSDVIFGGLLSMVAINL
jgi:hypothetical protein